MKLLFKQRIFSWLDSYDIYGEDGHTAYTVEGRLGFGHRLDIFSAQGAPMGQVKEKVFRFLPRFELYDHEQYIGEVYKELTLFRPVYCLDCMGWRIEGNMLAWDYRVADAQDRLIMTASKQLFNFSDTYIIDIVDPENALLSLMIVLAIDAANCN